MAKNRFVIFPLLCLVFLMATLTSPAWGSNVKFVNFSNASGTPAGNANAIRFTVGQSAVGSTDPVAGVTMAGLGIWEMLYTNSEATPVDDLPLLFGDGLFGNYPNPFNPSTKISYSLKQETDVLIEVYDLKGRRVDTLVDEVKPAGEHTLTYQPEHLASGAYLVLMRAGSFRASQRMMLLK